ncbi:MAG: Crp/Fnr family transcriptional regulator [Abitibacteriaceae bacterium]|nr:Crp/Fnr family transcriptional regulator [Abditibacteriaceae bacterium]
MTHSHSHDKADAQDKRRCKNSILAALPDATWERLAPHLHRVLLHQGDALHESDALVEYVYFIESGMISLVVDAPDGQQVEAGVTGSEGLVGLASVLCQQPTFHRAVVQLPGQAYRLPADTFSQEWQRDSQLQQLLHHYLYVLFAQASQTALCNRIHTLEERLSRWLMTVRDRVQSNDLDLTHEFISHMLGVRRSGVTVALSTLQQAGLIDTSRGHIAILNDQQLENCCCQCYRVIQHQFQMFTDRTSA